MSIDVALSDWQQHDSRAGKFAKADLDSSIVDSVLETLKSELERFGAQNDSATKDRSRRMLNITRDTGEFLSVLIRAMSARWILELGTSNGYSTLWLAEAARAIGGMVITVESAEHKLALAAANFERANLASTIKLVHDDAARVLQQTKDSAHDFVFLDADRATYVEWWTRVFQNGLVVRDGPIFVLGLDKTGTVPDDFWP